MVLVPVLCPICQSSDIAKHGTSVEGKARYNCRHPACERCPFILNDSYGGRLPAVKPQISDRALNGSGIWDTARVLHISPSKASKRQAVLQRIWLSWNRARPGFAFVSGKS